MTAAQRKALRTVAFDVSATERGEAMSRRRSAAPTDAASLLTWRQPMRNSFLALTRLQRVELFVDAWPGIEAVKPFSIPAEVIDKTFRHGTYHMIGDWIRLLEQQDVEEFEFRGGGGRQSRTRTQYWAQQAISDFRPAAVGV